MPHLIAFRARKMRVAALHMRGALTRQIQSRLFASKTRTRRHTKLCALTHHAGMKRGYTQGNALSPNFRTGDLKRKTSASRMFEEMYGVSTYVSI